MDKDIFQKPQKINSHRFFEGNKKAVSIYLILIILIIIFASKGFPGFDFSETEQSKAAIAQEQVIISLQAARGPLLYDFHQLKAAGALMSDASGVFEYGTRLNIEDFLHQEIEITTFPGWEDIDTEIGGRIVKDPLTFYFYIPGNEWVISFAETLLWGGDSGEPPPEDWIPPNSIPGSLQHPVNLAIPAVSYSSHFYKHRVDHYHAGIDLDAPQNSPVFAAADGIVININKTDRQGGGYGYWILIFHDKLNISTHYAHLDNVGVSPGQRVEARQVIGGVGNTGATAYHLHFEVYPCQVDSVGTGKGYFGGKVNCYVVDPIAYLPAIPKSKCTFRWDYWPDHTPTPPAECKSCILPSQQCQ